MVILSRWIGGGGSSSFFPPDGFPSVYSPRCFGSMWSYGTSFFSSSLHGVFLFLAASLLFSANETFAGSGGNTSPSVVEEPVSDPGFEGDFLVCCTSPL